MKPTLPAFALVLGLLASCTPDTATKPPAADAVEQFYGGTAQYKKGSHFSTDPHELQGNYLEMTLANYAPGRDFADLRLPAANCARLVYGSLTPAERQNYSYLRITLQDSVAAHTYTFGLPELVAVRAATADLAALLADMQRHDYRTAATRFNLAALGGPDSVRALLARMEVSLSPFSTYKLHGYSLVNPDAANPGQQLVRLFVETQGENNHNLLAVVNPQLRAEEKFMYGLALLN